MHIEEEEEWQDLHPETERKERDELTENRKHLGQYN